MDAKLILMLQERSAIDAQFLRLAENPFDNLERLAKLALVGGRMDKLIRDRHVELRKARRA